MDIPALPFSKTRNSMSRPKPDGYPKILKTIGDHVRKWRMDNGLVQRDVAEMLGVCLNTVEGWESRKKMPAIRQMPGIIRLLGYLPIQIDSSTMSGNITYYRYMRGITQEELAKELGVNESTVFHYEKGTHKPVRKTSLKLQALFNTVTFNMRDFPPLSLQETLVRRPKFIQ
jgi:DNA-binding XRE family transcriptional regulator